MSHIVQLFFFYLRPVITVNVLISCSKLYFPLPVLCLFDTIPFVFSLKTFDLNFNNFIATLCAFNVSPFYIPSRPSRVASIYLFVFASFVWCHFTTSDCSYRNLCKRMRSEKAGFISDFVADLLCVYVPSPLSVQEHFK